MTGEVGEQRAVLDHAFFAIGETPDAVLNQDGGTAPCVDVGELQSAHHSRRRFQSGSMMQSGSLWSRLCRARIT